MDNAKSFEIQFSGRQMARAIQVQNKNDLRAALLVLGLDRPRPTLVLVGGAAGLGKSLAAETRHLFVDVLAPLAQALGAYVVDGATDSGVIRVTASPPAPSNTTTENFRRVFTGVKWNEVIEPGTR